MSKEIGKYIEAITKQLEDELYAIEKEINRRKARTRRRFATKLKKSPKTMCP